MLESLLFNIAALRTGEKEDVFGLRGASLKVGEERGGERGRIRVCVYGGGGGEGGEREVFGASVSARAGASRV